MTAGPGRGGGIITAWPSPLPLSDLGCCSCLSPCACTYIQIVSNSRFSTSDCIFFLYALLLGEKGKGGFGQKHVGWTVMTKKCSIKPYESSLPAKGLVAVNPVLGLAQPCQQSYLQLRNTLVSWLPGTCWLGIKLQTVSPLMLMVVCSTPITFTEGG